MDLKGRKNYRGAVSFNIVLESFNRVLTFPFYVLFCLESIG